MESLKKSRNTMFLRREIQEGGTEKLLVGGRGLRGGGTWALSGLSDSSKPACQDPEGSLRGLRRNSHIIYVETLAHHITWLG